MLYSCVSANERLYSWGWNEHGICATGDETNVTLPHIVQILGTEAVTKIGCGAGHSFVITNTQSHEDNG